jgi:hypothetical protein
LTDRFSCRMNGFHSEGELVWQLKGDMPLEWVAIG